MSIDSQTKLRLQFLSRVVKKECYHLKRTTERLFEVEFSIEKAKLLDSDDDLSEQVEAFSSRFARLQDTLGDKLLPQLLMALGEKYSTAVNNFDKAERLGWIPSSDKWQMARQLRNQMVHEYIEDLQILTSAIKSAQNFVPILLLVSKNLQEELEKQGWGSL